MWHFVEYCSCSNYKYKAVESCRVPVLKFISTRPGICVDGGFAEKKNDLPIFPLFFLCLLEAPLILTWTKTSITVVKSLGNTQVTADKRSLVWQQKHWAQSAAVINIANPTVFYMGS